MKIAFAFPPTLLSDRRIDLHRIDDDPRGLTGSEASCVYMAREMARRGHATTLFIPSPNASTYGDLKIVDFWHFAASAERFDIVVAHNDASVLVGPTGPSGKRPFRVMFQQVNGFEAAPAGFEDEIDLFVSPSHAHLRFLRSRPELRCPPEDRFIVLPNGCYPAAYARAAEKKVSGRVLYASSPDRGLHLVLQEWPAIKRAVPHASLRIAYYALGRYLDEWRGREVGLIDHPIFKEHCARSQYIEAALSIFTKDARWGVEIIPGGLSRNAIADEMMAAEVYAYPCDPISFTEGFSCSTLEACAASAVPVLYATDALGEIYGDVAAMAPRGDIARWREHAIEFLKNPTARESYTSRARAFVEQHTWPELADQFETALYARGFSLCAAIGVRQASAISKRTESENKMALETQVKEYSFKGHPYKIAYGYHEASWATFEDEAAVRDLNWNVAKGDYVLDIGAGFGSYSLTALAAGAAKVWAWSPQRTGGGVLEALLFEESLRLNGWEDRCAVFRHGLYSKAGSVNTVTQEFSSKLLGELEAHGDSINVLKLDDWAVTKKLSTGRYWFKLDVEGAEVEVLKGAEKTIHLLRPTLLVENHVFKGEHLERDVRALVTRWGYKEVRTTPYGSVSHSLYTSR